MKNRTAIFLTVLVLVAIVATVAYALSKKTLDDDTAVEIAREYIKKHNKPQAKYALDSDTKVTVNVANTRGKLYKVVTFSNNTDIDHFQYMVYIDVERRKADFDDYCK